MKLIFIGFIVLLVIGIVLALDDSLQINSFGDEQLYYTYTGDEELNMVFTNYVAPTVSGGVSDGVPAEGDGELIEEEKEPVVVKILKKPKYTTLLIICVIGYFIYINYQNKKEMKKIEKRKLQKTELQGNREKQDFE